MSKVAIVYGDERAGDIPHSLASIEKAKKLLGYQPEYDVHEGLEESLEWYWKNLKAQEVWETNLSA